MRRRDFSLASLATIILTSCNLQTQLTGNEISVGKISGEITEVLNGLNALVIAPTVQTLLSTANLATVETALGDARDILTTLSASPRIIALVTAQSWVSKLEISVNTIFNVLEGTDALPPTALVIIEAVRVLMPVILAAVQILITATTPTGLTQPQAEQILKNPII
jgi:hypothetical protein